MSPKKEISDELQALGSMLADMPKVLPYAVPEDYFTGLPAQVLTTSMETIQGVGLPRELPFEVPAQYFEELPANLLAVIHRQDETQPLKVPLRFHLHRTFRLAAAAVLLLLAGAGIFRYALQQHSFESQLAALPAEAVEEYVRQNMDGFDIGTGAPTPADELASSAHLTEEEITQYLDETGWN